VCAPASLLLKLLCATAFRNCSHRFKRVTRPHTSTSSAGRSTAAMFEDSDSNCVFQLLKPNISSRAGNLRCCQAPRQPHTYLHSPVLL
jgi:hypothetical protein